MKPKEVCLFIIVTSEAAKIIPENVRDVKFKEKKAAILV